MSYYRSPRFISTTPVAVTVLKTAGDGLTSQMKSYASRHSSLLMTALFLILVIERDHLREHVAPCYSGADCDLRSDFSFFKIIFELVSAYGTVGLSLGSARTPNSFCTDWHPASQLVLAATMLLGRLRGFPVEIETQTL